MKKGSILTENVIFIILNLAFLAILLLFVFLKSSPTHVLEETTAKQIALLIDASKPDTEIKLNVKEAIGRAKSNGVEDREAIEIDGNNNLVIVKLSEKSYYDYCFFNDVDVAYSIVGDYLEMNVR